MNYGLSIENYQDIAVPSLFKLVKEIVRVIL